jgi:hypothetical protein
MMKKLTILVDTSQPSWLLEGLLRARAGNTGEFVHNNQRRDGWHKACPFCGCRSRFSFIEDDEDKQAMDVFECLRCLATHTRLDAVGVEEWKEMEARARRRRKEDAL